MSKFFAAILALVLTIGVFAGLIWANQSLGFAPLWLIYFFPEIVLVFAFVAACVYKKLVS